MITINTLLSTLGLWVDKTTGGLAAPFPVTDGVTVKILQRRALSKDRGLMMVSYVVYLLPILFAIGQAARPPLVGKAG